MLPALILCHNLTLADSSNTFTASFQAAVFAQDSTTTNRRARRAVFLFSHLKFFLTCLDTDVKRFAGEWLYLLCNENGSCQSPLVNSSMDHTKPYLVFAYPAEEYTRRTGVGNAIGMLRVKGLA